MRIRTVLAAAVLAAVAAPPLAGVASAQPAGRDCRDFASQAAAQSVLRSHSGGPAQLDADQDGIACEDYFGQGAVAPPVTPAIPGGRRVDEPVVDRDPRAAVPPPAAPAMAVPEHQVPVPPRGAPDTGDGSTAPLDTAPSHAAPLDTTPPGLLAAGLGAVAALGAAYLVVRRSPRTWSADRGRSGARRRSAGRAAGRAR
jgi:Excalibur calcium-binding domain